MLIPSRAFGYLRAGLNGHFGVTVPNFGTGGTHDNPLLNDVDAGDEAAGVEFCPVFAAQEASGVLTSYTDGSITFVGAADGFYDIPYTLYTFTPGDSASVDEGATTYDITVGAVGYDLAADTGAFTLTGQAATLSASRVLSAETGAFVLSGQDSTISVSRVLSAETGTFTLAGPAAGLTVSRALAAETGAFVLTGQAATLTYTPIGAFSLAAETGAFTLTGQSAGLTVSRVLSAETGAFVLSGQAATLFKGLTLAAETGAFVLTGQDAQFARTRVLLAEMGAYVLTGNAATLAYSGGDPDETYPLAGESQAYPLTTAQTYPLEGLVTT